MIDLIVHFQCPYCFDAFADESKAKECLESCNKKYEESKKKYDEILRVHQLKLDEVTIKALEFASTDPAVKLLVKNGLEADAEKLYRLYMETEIEYFDFDKEEEEEINGIFWRIIKAARKE